MRRAVTVGAWWMDSRLATAGAVAAAVLAVFLAAHQMTLHHALTGIVTTNEGPNFASSVALTHATFPYESYPLAQPPGMTVLLLPFAWLSHFVVPADALIIARIATEVATVLVVLMVGLAARQYGVGASLLAGVFTAIYPFAFQSTMGVTVAPWMAFCCLLALLLAFTEGELASGPRVFFAGALVGFAVTMKPWAIVPAVMLLAVAAIAWRSKLLPVLGGIAIGIGVPSVLFAVAAPGAFWRDVVLAELPHGPHGSAAGKLAQVLGLGAPSGFHHPEGLAVAIAIALGVVILAVFLVGISSAAPYDYCILVTPVLLVAAVLLPGAMAPTYGEFAMPFIALLVSVSASRLLLALAASWSGRASDLRGTLASAGGALLIGAGVVVLAIGGSSSAAYATKYATHHGFNPRHEIARAVPKGACAIAGNVNDLVLAGRYLGTAACPPAVSPTDSLAIFETEHKSLAAARAAAATQWKQWMSIAHDVVLSKEDAALPWTPSLRRFLKVHFVVLATGRVTVYQSPLAVP